MCLRVELFYLRFLSILNMFMVHDLNMFMVHDLNMFMVHDLNMFQVVFNHKQV